MNRIAALQLEKPRNWIVEVTLASGETGYGEIVDVHALPVVFPVSAFEEDDWPQVVAGLVGASWNDVAGLARLTSGFAGPLRFGLVSALLDAWCKATGTRVAHLLGRHAQEHVPVRGVCRNAAELAACVAAGHTDVKLKTTGDWLSLLQQALATGLRVVVDANGGWDDAMVAHVLGTLSQADQARLVLEQPLAADDLAGHRQLRHEFGVAVVLDESIYLFDIAEIVAAEAADGVVFKPGLLGYLPTLDLADAATAGGLSVCITHVMDGMTGRLAARDIAAMCGTASAHGLDMAGVAA